MNAERVLVATIHPDLAVTLAAAGAEVVGSAAEVEARLAAGEPRALLVSQDLPGVTPERIRTWARDRGDRVAVWLEDAPPPAWRTVMDTVTAWYGDLSAREVAAWLDAHPAMDGFGLAAAVHLVLETPAGVRGPDAVRRWAESLAARHGPGLVVDADWSGGALTERLLPDVWERRKDARSLAPIRWRLGWFAPAPPPWDVLPADPTREHLHTVQSLNAPWTVVYLGGDLRDPLALRWLSAAADLLWIPSPHAARVRLSETADLIQSLAPAVTVAVSAPHRVAHTVAVAADWPVQSPPRRGGKSRPVARLIGRARRLWSSTAGNGGRHAP
jgi:hypothetical protein